MPIFLLSEKLTIEISILGWIAWSFLVGFIGHCLPLSWLLKDTPITQLYNWLDSQDRYEKLLKIKWWKDKLPDAGQFFPRGIAKSLQGKCSILNLQRQIIETRRAEYVHWCIWLFWIPTILWMPIKGVLISCLFATAFNLPCLLVQRYNRLRILQLERAFLLRRKEFRN